jgi:hypothetical protein
MWVYLCNIIMALQKKKKRKKEEKCSIVLINQVYLLVLIVLVFVVNCPVRKTILKETEVGVKYVSNIIPLYFLIVNTSKNNQLYHNISKSKSKCNTRILC